MTAPSQEYRTIPLNHGQVTIVDLKDYERLAAFLWRHEKAKMPTGYAVLCGHDNGRERKMHNIIMKPPVGFEVDHKDGDGLNNRRDNLRFATRSQQSMNRHRDNKRKGTSKYRGVRWWKTGAKWQARIKLNQREIHLGYFQNEQTAALAYNEAARRLFKEFACLNKI